MKLDLDLIDVCTCDYFNGSKKAYLQIAVEHGMTLRAVKDALKSELHYGQTYGHDRLAYLLSSDFVKLEEEKEAIQATKKAYAAINKLKPYEKNKRKLFTNLEKTIDDSSETIYAYFIFNEV